MLNDNTIEFYDNVIGATVIFILLIVVIVLKVIIGEKFKR